VYYFVQPTFYGIADTDHAAERAFFHDWYMAHPPVGHLAEQIPTGIGELAGHHIPRHDLLDPRTEEVRAVIGQAVDKITLGHNAVNGCPVSRHDKGANARVPQALDGSLYCGIGLDRINVVTLVLKDFRNLHIVVSLKNFHGIHNAW
jgi:hypothetical protein